MKASKSKVYKCPCTACIKSFRNHSAVRFATDTGSPIFTILNYLGLVERFYDLSVTVEG